MADSTPLIHIDSFGVIRVGSGSVPLDDIVASHRKGQSTQAIVARFPSLTVEQVRAALDYHAAPGNEAAPRGPQQRDANWQRWNATLAEDTGTDTPPNRPVRGNGSVSS